MLIGEPYLCPWVKEEEETSPAVPPSRKKRVRRKKPSSPTGGGFFFSNDCVRDEESGLSYPTCYMNSYISHKTRWLGQTVFRAQCSNEIVNTLIYEFKHNDIKVRRIIFYRIWTLPSFKTYCYLFSGQYTRSQARCPHSGQSTDYPAETKTDAHKTRNWPSSWERRASCPLSLPASSTRAAWLGLAVPSHSPNSRERNWVLRIRILAPRELTRRWYCCSSQAETSTQIKC